MLTHKKYVLASSSKSRYKILKNTGFNFIQVNPTCNEEKIKKEINKKNIPSIVAKKLSYEKARSISKTDKYFDHYVIGCDTLIYINNKIFNKAKNIKEAKMKIKNLSGKKHKIVSGVTICKNGKKLWECTQTSQVTMRKLTHAQIEKYLKKTGKQVLNSVGCYQIESFGPHIVENISGDLFNVMGLPLFKLLKRVLSI